MACVRPAGVRIGWCSSCGAAREIMAHRWCTRCYRRWLYHGKPPAGPPPSGRWRDADPSPLLPPRRPARLPLAPLRHRRYVAGGD
jgi:hypothetical protein